LYVCLVISQVIAGCREPVKRFISQMTKYNVLSGTLHPTQLNWD